MKNGEDQPALSLLSQPGVTAAARAGPQLTSYSRSASNETSGKKENEKPDTRDGCTLRIRCRPTHTGHPKSADRDAWTGSDRIQVREGTGGDRPSGLSDPPSLLKLSSRLEAATRWLSLHLPTLPKDSAAGSGRLHTASRPHELLK
ncbi:hypothetical protein JZ751_024837 [Albula glossodonta]|uniref:Uncharacterized protein n=1 Tax=Albula glossodonta TaxID=121402 RepID=A0A8T2PM25_9TELE|nr:hypothetical protein JZ751_024837 [Albula glossodonta]